MDALAGYSSSDSGSGSGSDSDSDASRTEKPSTGSGLAAPSELFASVDTAILKGHKTVVAGAAAAQAAAAPPPHKVSTTDTKKRATEDPAPTAGKRVKVGSTPVPTAAMPPPRKPSVAPGKRLVGSSVSKKAKDDKKKTAKDRVKNQRQKGQAGIGSDFREWRSEEEMRMRQQFD